jgi:hypothetical protein
MAEGKVIETGTTPQTLEELLAPIHTRYYETMGAAEVHAATGRLGILNTNEHLPATGLKIVPPPNGYIIGSGNGAIWEMLEHFPEGTLPKGIVSLDISPIVTLSGKMVTALAKGARGNLDARGAINWLYGEYIFDKSPGLPRIGQTEIEALAREVAMKETNFQFRQVLLGVIDNGTFFKEIGATRAACELEGFTGPVHRGEKKRMNMPSLIYQRWETIKQLAKEGKIFFAHSDIANPSTINFIAEVLPDIGTSRNILYTSNIVDFRYRQEIDVLERLNPNKMSVYVFTTQSPDNYGLKTAASPPRRP